MPLSHDELLNLTLGHDLVEQRTYSFTLDENQVPGLPSDLVYHDACINPAFINLVGASLHMYKVLTKLDVAIESLIEWFEENELDASAGTLTDMSASIKLCLRYAVEGHLLNACKENRNDKS